MEIITYNFYSPLGLQRSYFYWGYLNFCKILAIALFFFNAVELETATIIVKPWTCAKEVWKLLNYNKKTTHIIKLHCSSESFAQNCGLLKVLTVDTLMDWPKDLREDECYINEKEMHELLLSSHQQKEKTQRGIAAICSFLIFKRKSQTRCKKIISRPFRIFEKVVQEISFGGTKRCLPAPDTEMSGSDTWPCYQSSCTSCKWSR